MGNNFLHARIYSPNKQILIMLLDTVATQVIEMNQKKYHSFSLASGEIACMLWK